MEINDLTRDDGRMNSTIRPHAKPGARPTGGLEGLGDWFLSSSVIAVPEASTGSAGRGVAVAGYTGRSAWNGRRLQRGHSRPPGFCSRARTARTVCLITAANRACSEGLAPEVARHLVSPAVVVLRMAGLLCAFHCRADVARQLRRLPSYICGHHPITQTRRQFLRPLRHSLWTYAYFSSEGGDGPAKKLDCVVFRHCAMLAR